MTQFRRDRSHIVTRRSLFKLTTSAALVSAGAALLAACGGVQSTAIPSTSKPAGPAATSAPGAAAASPTRGGMVRIGIFPESGELNILRPTSVTTKTYARAFYNSLTRVDLQGNVTGELAESWSLTDPTTYVFKLRPGVKFHDGTPFDAEAVKFNMEWTMDPKNRGNNIAELTLVSGVEVVDPLTVRIKLKQPDVTLPARLIDQAGNMVAPSAIKQFGDQLSTNAVGTGPFQLVEWVKGDHLTVKRFDGYWEKDEQGNSLPYLDGITFKPIEDPSVMLTNVRTGNLDLIQHLLPADIPKVTSDQSLTSIQGPGAAQIFFLNGEKFKNKNLRQAIAWAIDREAIHKAIYFGTGAPGQYILSPQSWGFDANSKFYTRDLAQAKARLAEGGVPDGFKFTALFNNAPIDLAVGQAIQGQLAEVGIMMEVVPLDASTYTDRRKKGEFEAGLSLSAQRADPSQNTTMYFRTGSNQNYNYSNPQVDALLAQAIAREDRNERKAIYSQIQSIVLDDAYHIFIHTDADFKVMSKSVQGFYSSLDTLIRLPTLWKSR